MAEPIWLKHTAQPGNVPLHQVHGIPGRRLTPHRIDHLLPAHRPTRLQRQHRQNHSLLKWPEIYSGLAPPNPKRAKQAESRRHDRIIHIPSRCARDSKQNLTPKQAA